MLRSTDIGLCPTGMVLVAPVATSIAVNASPSWSATYTVAPSGETARPAGYRLTGWPAGLVVGSGRGAPSVNVP